MEELARKGAGSCDLVMNGLHRVNLGCVGGGGEPKNRTLDKHILQKRIAAIHSIDSRRFVPSSSTLCAAVYEISMLHSKVRMSHHNEAVKALYDEFLGDPNSEQSHALLHTYYTDRTGEVKTRTDLRRK